MGLIEYVNILIFELPFGNLFKQKVFTQPTNNIRTDGRLITLNLFKLRNLTSENELAHTSWRSPQVKDIAVLLCAFNAYKQRRIDLCNLHDLPLFMWQAKVRIYPSLSRKQDAESSRILVVSLPHAKLILSDEINSKIHSYISRQ